MTGSVRFLLTLKEVQANKAVWLTVAEEDVLSGREWFDSTCSRQPKRLLRESFRWGLTLSGTKTHVKQRFLPLTPLLMVSDVLWSPVLPA
ncbi:hypothetical protein DN614_30915 [Klebsiella michiganensis]|nr:hypothetical protein DN614_30915 [Klebsiella michiganensis]